ncbi:MAG: hypothetical protein WC479_05265 [Candidatus Izemoplasmatales bacterium]|jgi:hypothetical protein
MSEQEVKIISITGKAAVVRIGDKTYIIARSYIGNTKVGHKVLIPIEAISTGTEHGIDWSVIIPDGITITPEEIQSALYSQGIFTIEDVEHNPNGVVNAVGSLIRKTSANLYKKVHEIIGGT